MLQENKYVHTCLHTPPPLFGFTPVAPTFGPTHVGPPQLFCVPLAWNNIENIERFSASDTERPAFFWGLGRICFEVSFCNFSQFVATPLMLPRMFSPVFSRSDLHWWPEAAIPDLRSCLSLSMVEALQHVSQGECKGLTDPTIGGWMSPSTISKSLIAKHVRRSSTFLWRLLAWAGAERLRNAVMDRGSKNKILKSLAGPPVASELVCWNSFMASRPRASSR